MDYEESMKFFDLIRQTGNKNDENWMKLYYDFLEHGVKIAHTRVQTYFKTPKDVVEEYKSMSGQYYNLISSIDRLAHYANVKGWTASFFKKNNREEKTYQ